MVKVGTLTRSSQKPPVGGFDFSMEVRYDLNGQYDDIENSSTTIQQIEHHLFSLMAHFPVGWVWTVGWDWAGRGWCGEVEIYI